MHSNITSSATLTMQVQGQDQLAREVECLREGGREAVEAQASRVRSALDCGDARGACLALKIAASAQRLPQVLSVNRAGRRVDAELAEAWRKRGLSPLGADGLAADNLARALVGAFVAGGDITATGALLACLAGRAAPALLADEAFAARAGARDPAMVRLLLGCLSVDQRMMALASGRGEIVAALLARRDADDLLSVLLDEIVALSDSALAARLLRETPGLLATAARERRLVGALGPLLALAGPDFRAVIEEHRAVLQRFRRGADIPA